MDVYKNLALALVVTLLQACGGGGGGGASATLPPANKMDDAMMRPAESVLGQNRVGVRRKVTIRKEQQLDAVPQVLVRQQQRQGRGVVVHAHRASESFRQLRQPC